MAKAKKSHTEDEWESNTSDSTPNPAWFKPVMFGFLLVGFLWIVVYYIVQNNNFPIPGIGAWNLVSGFALVIVGLLMTTRWR